MSWRAEPILLKNARVFDGRADRGAGLAVRIRGGRIEAVGPVGEVGAAGAAERDLAGAFVMPGITDAHVHVGSLGRGMLQVDLFDCRSASECAARVAERAAETPPGGWVVARGWRKSIWATDEFPTAAVLDERVPDHPVFCNSFDGHCAWVNSEAMRVAGITAETPDSPGGEIGRDASGRPTGIFKENASRLISRVLPQATESEQREALRRAQVQLNRLGLTGVHAMEDFAAYERAAALARAGAVTLRFGCTCRPGEEQQAARARAGEAEDDLVRLVGMKTFIDGSMNTQTAAMFEPFEGGGSSGILTQTPEALRRQVARAADHRLPAFVHAIGDRGAAVALDAIAAGGDPCLPNRIEHAQVLRPEEVRRMADLGVAGSVQPAHILTDIGVSEKYLGPRCDRCFVFRSMLDAGVTLAFGSDAPVVPPDPRHGLFAGVARQDLSRSPPAGWHREQRLTPVEALSACCRGPAESVGQGGRLGRIAPGFLADLTVFAENPLAGEPQALLELTVVMTIVAGRIVFDATGGDAEAPG